MKRSGESLDKAESKRIRVYRNAVRTEAEEETEFIEVTTHGEKILPNNLKKYHGHTLYAKKGIKRWYAKFPGQYKSKAICFDTEEEASNWVREVNIKQEWPIRNIVYKYENKYYCALTQNKVMKFSLEHLDIVENHVWCSHLQESGYYATTSTRIKEKRKMMAFHQMMLPNLKKGETGDHINRITLDNTASNVRAASKTIQCINRRVCSKNKSTITGVSYEKTKRKNQYTATWSEVSGRCTKSFPISIYGKEMAFAKAVALRKEKENTLVPYKIALCK